ncbi:hypothetical protein LTR66_007853 [Elasticomyces elasticus]|nr:hypothetical protein LTR66_007853 [Elasticomyces elasticus]
MNIFGNAIKYTAKGWIRTPVEFFRGMSSEYLSTRLYTAFAQEDILAPGTGLGLCLVRRILTMLGGQIEVLSEVNRGTEVRICLPLTRRTTFRGVPVPMSDPSTSVYREQDGSIDCLRRRAERKTIALFGFDSDGKGSQRSSLIRESLATYITEWFGLTEVSTWSSSSPADILVADEVNLPALLAHGPKFPGSAAGPLLVILCSNATRYGQTTVYAEGGGVIEFVLKPVGPYKLARALNLCLERAGEAKRNSSSYRHVSEVSSVGPPKVNTAIENPCEATTGLQDGTPPSTNTRARDDVPVGEGSDDVPSATYISPVNTTDPPKLDPAGFPLPSSRPSEDGRGAEGSSSDLRQSRQSAASVELLL